MAKFRCVRSAQPPGRNVGAQLAVSADGQLGAVMIWQFSPRVLGVGFLTAAIKSTHVSRSRLIYVLKWIRVAGRSGVCGCTILQISGHIPIETPSTAQPHQLAGKEERPQLPRQEKRLFSKKSVESRWLKTDSKQVPVPNGGPQDIVAPAPCAI